MLSKSINIENTSTNTFSKTLNNLKKDILEKYGDIFNEGWELPIQSYINNMVSQKLKEQALSKENESITSLSISGDEATSKKKLQKILNKKYTKDYAFLPIRRPLLIKYYNEQRDAIWVPADINMKEDRHDWDEKCDDGIRSLIKGILKFFSNADAVINENIFDNFRKDTSMFKEASAFYAIQAAMETIHSETYSLMAQSLIRDQKELDEILNSPQYSISIQKINDFMFKYMNRNRSLLTRVVAFACVEGILFNSTFAAIYWVKKKNILRGFCKANEFICRDEGIHTKFAVELFYELLRWIEDGCPRYNEDEELDLLMSYIPTKEELTEVIQEIIHISNDFIAEILPVEMIGMSSNELLDYTKSCADSLAYSLGLDKIYNVENPYDWMVMISLPNKTNFFEDNVSEYAKQSEGDFEFDLDAEF